MELDVNKSVGEIAAAFPGVVKVFEKFRIDYCCAGHLPLAEACANRGVAVDDVVASIATWMPQAQPERDWNAASLDELSNHIVEKYHETTRESLERISRLVRKVVGVHGGNHPELLRLADECDRLANDMIPHMLKEEQVLFPYVTNLERALIDGQPAPTPFFGTVKNPVRKMMEEHDVVGEILGEIRKVTAEYAAPEDACGSFRELYRTLEELERETHMHIHLENNIYFPRAVALEDQSGSTIKADWACGTAGCAH
jgi:regulator of cell morphogenesis and NO signaling